MKVYRLRRNFQGAVTIAGALTASGGGALTGTWTDLGSITTVDINGGTIDGATVGATSASTGKFTTLEATTSAAFSGGSVTITEPTTTQYPLLITPAAAGIAALYITPATGNGALSALVYAADNTHLSFDAHYSSSGWVSDDAGSSFGMSKQGGDILKFVYDTAAVGAGVTWNTAGQIDLLTGALTWNAAVALGANNLTLTGTIAATGARVTQSYHTNITSTNAVTVDSARETKVAETLEAYSGDALSTIRDMEVVRFQHQHDLDPSDRFKLGVIAETVNEPLALGDIDKADGGSYKGVNLYGLTVVNTAALQALLRRVEALEAA